ncbi:MAG: orotate phosphoribosyltransferase [Pseudomonadota bacterium]
MPHLNDLASRIRNCARLSGSFTLRSGATSDTYFDKYLFESDPALLYDICVELAERLAPETEVLAGLEMGGIPVVTMLSHITRKPAAFIRKEAKSYGTCKYAEGADLAGKKITLIEDVVSSGGAIVDALHKLNADGIYPLSVACVIDRQSGGAENVDQAGCTLSALFTMADIEHST